MKEEPGEYKICKTCTLYIIGNNYCLEWKQETTPYHYCIKYAFDWAWRKEDE